MSRAVTDVQVTFERAIASSRTSVACAAYAAIGKGVLRISPEGGEALTPYRPEPFLR